MSQVVAVVLGTRPEIIKLAGIIRELGPRCQLIHSGQHYDEDLSNVFFQNFGLPAPSVRLANVGGHGRGLQFAQIITQLTALFEESRPAAVVVQGDTNTVAAAAHAASFLGIPVVHVEAGLRSYDRAMPEEINRQLAGVVADLHCAPTQAAAHNLLAEGIPAERIVVTGNTVVEATLEMLPPEDQRIRFLANFGLVEDGYVVATIHRPENTDDPESLSTILAALASLELPVVFPMHPRTMARIVEFELTPLLARLRVIDPVDHRTFLALAAEARLLVSDSGGIQEECTVIKRPLLVIRNSTERPEAIDAGFARRALPDDQLLASLRLAAGDGAWHESLKSVPSPYGDGTASRQVVSAMDDLLGSQCVVGLEAARG